MLCLWAEMKRKKCCSKWKKNKGFFLRNRNSPLKNIAAWCFFKVPSFWLLRCGMQEEPFTKSTRIIVWQQKSLSAFPGNSLLTRRVAFSNATFQTKIQPLHSVTALNYKASDFHWGEPSRIQQGKKEHLLDFVRDKEVKIKTASYTNPLRDCLHWI